MVLLELLTQRDGVAHLKNTGTHVRGSRNIASILCQMGKFCQGWMIATRHGTMCALKSDTLPQFLFLVFLD